MSLSFLEQLSESSRNDLIKNGCIINAKKGKAVVESGTCSEKIYILLEGYASVTRAEKFGEKRIIFVLGKGEILNETAIDYSINVNSIISLTDTEVLALNTSDFLELIYQNAELAQALVKTLSIRNRKLYHQLGNYIGCNTLENRVAVKIWKLACDYGIQEDNGIIIPFEIPVTFLACMLGAKRETVSRIMTKYKEDNLITIENKYITVTDMERLKNIINRTK